MEQSVKQFEHEALIRCLGLHTDAASTQKLRGTLAQVIDWDYLLKTALHHGVFPSLYRRVADFCPEAAPPAVLADWQRLYTVNARRNFRLVGELFRVMDLLESHGIAAVSLKGPVLAKMAYGDMAMRQSTDLDLLVRVQDMPAVKESLGSAGYRLDYTLTPREERLHISRGHELSFVHPKLTELDIHWGFPNFLGDGLDPEAAFGRKILITLEGRPIYSLTSQDAMLFLCMNATFAAWPNLCMVNDVARLLESQEPWDWPGLLHRAESSGMRRSLLLGLSLAQELLGAAVPSEVAAMADSDLVLSGLHQYVRGKLLSFTPREDKFGERSWFQIKVRERFRDKLAFVWVRTAVPQTVDWWGFPLPDFLYWLYPIIRPLRLVTQYVIQPLGRNLLSTWKAMASSRLLVRVRSLGKPSKRR